MFGCDYVSLDEFVCVGGNLVVEVYDCLMLDIVVKYMLIFGFIGELKVVINMYGMIVVNVKMICFVWDEECLVELSGGY